MIKIKVPIPESKNDMKLAKKKDRFGSKFVLAQAIIKKYKDTIFWKHECIIKREERKSSQMEDSDTSPLCIRVEEPKDDNLNSISSSRVTRKSEHPQENQDFDEDEFIHTSNLDLEIDIESHRARTTYKSDEMEPRLLLSAQASKGRMDSAISAGSSIGYYKKRYIRYEKGYCVTYIYITDIAKILVSNSVLIILKENFEVIKFLRNDDKVSDLISLATICAANAKEMLKKTIEVHRVATLSDEIAHVTQHFNKHIFFSSLIFSEDGYYFDSYNNIRKVNVRVDRDSIHILKDFSNLDKDGKNLSSSAGLFISAPLKGLKFVYVYDVLPIVRTHSEL